MLALLALALAMIGLGMGMSIPTLFRVIVERVDPRHAGLVGGLVNSTLQVSAAMGVALLGGLYFTELGKRSDAGSIARAFSITLLGVASCHLVGAALGAGLGQKRKAPAAKACSEPGRRSRPRRRNEVSATPSMRRQRPQQAPGVDARVVAVVEADANGVIADLFDGEDHDRRPPGCGTRVLSALGLAPRSRSEDTVPTTPSSNVTLSRVPFSCTRNSLGQGPGLYFGLMVLPRLLSLRLHPRP